MIVAFPGRAHLFLLTRPMFNYKFACVIVAFPFAATGWSVICDCGISWSFSLVSLDGAHILNINLPLFLWRFLLITQVSLWSVILVFPGRSHLFLSMRHIF